MVFEPRFYEGFADMMKNDELPIFNWIWFGLWQNEKGLNGYTYGMDAFGKDEMEVLDTDADPNDLRDFLASLVSYVLENDVELHDGETIAFAADDNTPSPAAPESLCPRSDDPENLPGHRRRAARKMKEKMTRTLKTPDEPEDEASQDQETSAPEVYSEEEMEVIEGHIQQYFGNFETVLHELSSPDIHVDICVVPPSEEHDYYTLVTMGMGAHR